MKKATIGLALGFSIFLAVGAFAGGGKEAAAASGGAVVLNIYANSPSDDTITKWVSLYNSGNPGVRVVYHSIPEDDYDDKIKVLTAGASDLDIFWVRTPGIMQQFITNKVVTDLTGYVTASGLDLAPIRDTSLPGAMRDGKIYGFPGSGPCWLLFYNRDLFDAKGIPYPGQLTWARFADLAKQLTYTDGGVKYWGGMIPPWTMNLGASSGGEYLTAKDLPLTKQYAEFLRRVYQEDKSCVSLGEMSQGAWDVNGYFEAGNIYMMINGDWEFFLLNPSLNFGVAPLPVFDGVAPGSSVGNPVYYAVNGRSAHKQEAYDFIQWATTSPEGTRIIAETKNVPCYLTPEALEAYKKSVSVPGVEHRLAAKIGQEQGPEPYYIDLNEAFLQEMQLYLLGEQDIDRAFKNYEALRVEVLGKR